MNLQELNHDVFFNHPELSRRLSGECASWRGLFDNLSAEWDNCTPPVKIAFLRDLMKIHPLQTILDAYFEFYNNPRKKYVLLALKDSLAKLYENGFTEVLECKIKDITDGSH